MTVKQLIALLQALPQDLPIYLGDWNEGYVADIPLDHVDAGREAEGPQLLPRVAEAYVLPQKWDHPRRVVIG
jgi:hypothetical protein